jgi:hypothetical protein
MKRMRIMGLCLVALFASTAVMAASASAEAPEYGRCLAKAGGKFKEGACKTASKPGEEKFEWYAAFGSEKPLVKRTYKAKAVATETAKIQLEGTGEKLGVKTVVACKEQSSEGEITGNKEDTAKAIVFKGCESSKVACSTTGAETGEIQVKELDGTIGIEKRGYNKEKKEEVPASSKIAHEFTPKGPVGEKFVNFNCATALAVTVRGHVLNPIKTNSMTLSAVVKFTAPGGNQKPEHFSTGIELATGKETFGPELSLEAAFVKPGLPEEFEESGQTLTTTQTNAEKYEASTVN